MLRCIEQALPRLLVMSVSNILSTHVYFTRCVGEDSGGDVVAVHARLVGGLRSDHTSDGFPPGVSRHPIVSHDVCHHARCICDRGVGRHRLHASDAAGNTHSTACSVADEGPGRQQRCYCYGPCSTRPEGCTCHGRGGQEADRQWSKVVSCVGQHESNAAMDLLSVWVRRQLPPRREK